jgi:hypothetical protein
VLLSLCDMTYLSYWSMSETCELYLSMESQLGFEDLKCCQEEGCNKL